MTGYDFEDELFSAAAARPAAPKNLGDKKVILSEDRFIHEQKISIKDKLIDTRNEESWQGHGIVITKVSSLGNGTNKLVFEFTDSSGENAAVLVLNKNDNQGNGIDAKEAERIARFYQIIGALSEGNFYKSPESDGMSATELLDRYKDILGLNKGDIKSIVDQISNYSKNKDDYAKIRNGSVKFGIARISEVHIITTYDRTGRQSEKLFYVCSKIDGTELKPEKDGSFDLQKSKDQASSYSSLTIFIDSFFSPEVLKKIFGSKAKDASDNEIYDPYHPQILRDKIDSVFTKEEYLYNLGLGVHLNVDGYKKGRTKEEQERIINEKVAEIKKTYSNENIVSVGKLHAKFLNAKIDTLSEYYKDLSKICTEGFVHGDTWHDNQKKNSFGEHLIFDLEEAGCGLHILDVAIQISDKGGIDEKTGKLNELGKAIFESAEENFQSKGKSIFNKKGKKLTPEEKEEALLKASALTSTYIEVMRAFKYVDGLYTKRNSFEQGIRSEIAIDSVSRDDIPRSIFTLKGIKQALSRLLPFSSTPADPNIVTFSGVIRSISENASKVKS